MKINLGDLISDKTKIINAIIILVTIPIAINIYKLQATNFDSLNMQKDMEMKKNELLERISQLGGKVNSYKKFLNNKNASLAVNSITNIAKDSGVKIISIKSDRQEDQDYYTRYSFSLMVASASYHTLGKFISKLESSPDVYFVDSINIRTQELGQEEYELEASLKLSTILFKD